MEAQCTYPILSIPFIGFLGLTEEEIRTLKILSIPFIGFLKFN